MYLVSNACAYSPTRNYVYGHKVSLCFQFLLIKKYIMTKDILFSCGGCKHMWRSSDYPDKTLVGETESVGWSNARDGYHCPQCHSKDISGEDL